MGKCLKQKVNELLKIGGKNKSDYSEHTLSFDITCRSGRSETLSYALPCLVTFPFLEERRVSKLSVVTVVQFCE